MGNLRLALWTGLLILLVVFVYYTGMAMFDQLLELLAPGSSTILDDGSILSYVIQGLFFLLDAISIGGFFLWIRR